MNAAPQSPLSGRTPFALFAADVLAIGPLRMPVQVAASGHTRRAQSTPPGTGGTASPDGTSKIRPSTVTTPPDTTVPTTPTPTTQPTSPDPTPTV